MSSSLKYLLLVAPAALMIAILFLYPLGFSLVSAFTAPGQPFHARSLPQGLCALRQ